MPTISVALATFNRLRFLRDTVASVFAQTFADWELVIADDGSDRETLAFLESLDDRRVRLIRLAHTGRPSIVRNAALREARGACVAFLDSDDLWRPCKLERQLDSLRRHPGRGWSYTRFELVDAAGRPHLPREPHDWPALSGPILAPLLETATVIALPSVVVTRPLLERAGGFDESLRMCEDYDLWLRLAALGEADAVDEPLTLVRRHREHSGDDVTAWRDRLRVIERLSAAHRDGPLSPVSRRLRAELAAGLAVSLVNAGRRAEAITALLESLPYGWAHARWWLRAGEAAVRAGLPRGVRAALGTLRSRRARARIARGTGEGAGTA